MGMLCSTTGWYNPYTLRCETKNNNNCADGTWDETTNECSCTDTTKKFVKQTDPLKTNYGKGKCCDSGQIFNGTDCAAPTTTE